MSKLADIRDALKVRLETISGLRAHDTWPDTINTPCAIVRPLQCNPHESESDLAQYTFEIVLLAAPLGMGYQRGQDAVDAYLETSGTKSIQAAIEGDDDLGGKAHTLCVTRWYDYDALKIDEAIAYWGVKFEVQVWA